MTAEGLASHAELVLDPRLAEVWQLVWSRDPGMKSADSAETAETVSEITLAALLRLAYLLGYADAFAEPEQGSLYRELGVRTPQATGRERARREDARRRPRSSDS